jgi:hypothetical protein
MLSGGFHGMVTLGIVPAIANGAWQAFDSRAPSFPYSP